MHHLLILLTNLLLSIAVQADVPGRPLVTSVPEAKLEGSCIKKEWPLESEHIAAYQKFCNNFVDDSIPEHIIRNTAPLMATYDAKNGAGTITKWVLEIICQWTNNTPYTANCNVSHKECMKRFGQFLDDVKIGGGLGKAYCVVDGTGGDFQKNKKGAENMSGQGTVLVWGGMIDTIDERLNGNQKVAQRAIYKARRKGENNTPT